MIGAQPERKLKKRRSKNVRLIICIFSSIIALINAGVNRVKSVFYGKRYFIFRRGSSVPSCTFRPTSYAKTKQPLFPVRPMVLLWHSYSQIFAYFTAKIIIYFTMTGDCGCFLLLAVHIHCMPRAFSEKLTPKILKMAD